VTVTETQIIAWREQQLARSGYAAYEALLLAHHVEVDLHEAIDLAGRGCPPELAVRILL
jgi:hypothetical protein